MCLSPKPKLGAGSTKKEQKKQLRNRSMMGSLLSLQWNTTIVTQWNTWARPYGVTTAMVGHGYYLCKQESLKNENDSDLLFGLQHNTSWCRKKKNAMRSPDILLCLSLEIFTLWTDLDLLADHFWAHRPHAWHLWPWRLTMTESFTATEQVHVTVSQELLPTPISPAGEDVACRSNTSL